MNKLQQKIARMEERKRKLRENWDKNQRDVCYKDDEQGVNVRPDDGRGDGCKLF